MLHNILKLEGVSKLNKNQLVHLKGSGIPPTNEEECDHCRGDWNGFFCALPFDAPPQCSYGSNVDLTWRD
ncbi:hypothetical protein [Aquimarina algiphila]|uniref:hypothetical protein n=1 Tax=Aquimarina algiphila TaxID=2047982 RepID=UPI00232C7D49|nr:hypothetical protein [Aquimarina algiphila]